MTWNEVVSSLRGKIQRGLARPGHHQEVQAAVTGTRLEPLGDAPFATPAMDVYENDKELMIVADVPGGGREDAKVAWDESRGLTLLVKSSAFPRGTVWGAEYQPNEWYGALSLPDYADGEKATSSLKDGVLTIRIPKRVAVSKRIPVQAG